MPERGAGMSFFEVAIVIAVVAAAITAVGIVALVSVLEKSTKHLAIIANRVIEIERSLNERR